MIAQLYFVVEIWWQWMSSMFWQVSLLVVLLTLVDMAIRRWAWPQVRYVLWGLVFLKLVIPPAWQMPTSVVSWLQSGVEDQIAIQIKAGGMDTEAQFAPNTAAPAQGRDSEGSGDEFPAWQAGLFLTWVAGVAAFGLALSIKMALLRRQQLAQKDSTLPEGFHKLLTGTARHMKLKHVPAVVFSGNAAGPAVFGLLRPKLLLPEGYLGKISEQQATHVILHELCHVKRGDLILHWFSLTLQMVYWFNPLLFWTRRQMRHVCEICCDLSVANILREKTHDYRNTLLGSARALLSESVDSSLGLLGIFEEPFRLVSRLKWLEKKTWRHRKRKIAATVLSGLVMFFCVMPMHGLSRPATQSEALSIPPENASGGPGAMNPRENPEPNPPMLFIEALIVEADMDIDYSAADAAMTIVAAPEIAVNGKAFSDIQAATQNLSNTPGARILGTPKLLTYLNNKKCSIEIGRGTKPEAGPPTGSAISESPGLLLELTPQLLEDGRMHQHVFLEITRETDNGITSDTVAGDVQFRESDMLMLMSDVPNAGTIPENKLFIFMKTRIVESPDELEWPS